MKRRKEVRILGRKAGIGSRGKNRLDDTCVGIVFPHFSLGCLAVWGNFRNFDGNKQIVGNLWADS